jgi:uncharacterized membrane protein
MSKIANWCVNQKIDMKISKPIIILGIIVIIAGIIFHLQGQAIVGPESSFMYSNPEWVSYGQQIAIIGIIVIGIGTAVKFLRKD